MDSSANTPAGRRRRLAEEDLDDPEALMRLVLAKAQGVPDPAALGRDLAQFLRRKLDEEDRRNRRRVRGGGDSVPDDCLVVSREALEEIVAGLAALVTLYGLLSRRARAAGVRHARLERRDQVIAGLLAAGLTSDDAIFAHLREYYPELVTKGGPFLPRPPRPRPLHVVRRPPGHPAQLHPGDPPGAGPARQAAAAAAGEGRRVTPPARRQPRPRRRGASRNTGTGFTDGKGKKSGSLGPLRPRPRFKQPTPS
jgi:hypothetical protein